MNTIYNTVYKHVNFSFEHCVKMVVQEAKWLVFNNYNKCLNNKFSLQIIWQFSKWNINFEAK